MFSKATLIGIVGIEPKYRTAADGKPSIIAFRLGCEVFTSSKKMTEWYTIKAFGRVADYLHTTIKKDSAVFLEASIRNKRWMVNGVERQGIEFHAFTARVMSESDASHHSDNDTVFTSTSDNKTYTEIEKTDTHVKEQPERPPKPLTAEEAHQVANRFRQTFEAQKKRIADLALNSSSKEEPSETKNVTSTSTGTSTLQRVHTVNACSHKTSTEILSGNPVTDKILEARSALRRSSGCALKKGNGYAHVRGGWPNVKSSI